MRSGYFRGNNWWKTESFTPDGFNRFQRKDEKKVSQMVAKRTKSCHEVDIVLNFQIYLYISLYIYIYTLWDYQWYTSFLWELFICIIYVYSTRRNFRKKRICSNRFFRAYENVKSGLRMHLFSIFFSHNSIGIQQKMHNPSQIPLFW